MGEVTGQDIYEYKVQSGATWGEVAEQFGKSREAVRSQARNYYEAKELPPPQEARIVGGLDEEPRVDRVDLWQRAIRMQERRAQVRERKESRRIIYDEGPVVIFFMGDMHLGGAGVNYLSIDRDLRLLNQLADSGVTVGVVSMGDIVDNMIVGRLREMRLNVSPFLAIEEWGLVDYALERLSPFLIGSVAGNHDLWSYSLSGLDPLRDRHAQLTPGILYDEFELGFTLQVGTSETRVICRHKWKGHSKVNPTHGLEDHQWTRGRDADVYVGGHTHRGGLYREFDNGGAVGHAVIIGTYKDDDSYGAAEGFPPVLDTSAVALVVDGDGVQFGTSNLFALQRFLGR